MEKRTEEMRVERKNGKAYERVNTITDKGAIHRSLEYTLLAKYLWKSPTVKRITDRTNYDGTRTITAYMTDSIGDYRYVYIVEE